MSYTDDFLTERARRDSRRQKGPSNEQRSERRARNVERFNARQAVNDEAAIASVAHGNVIVDAATARPSSLARTPEERAQQERAGRFLPRVGRGVAFAPEAFVLNPLGNPAMRAEIERARRQDHVEANGSYDIDPETGEGVSTLPVINANVPRPQGSVARSVRNAAAAAGDVARAAPGFVGAAAKEMFVDTPIRAATGFEEAGARLERGDKTGAVAPALRATEDTIYTGLNAELGLLGLGLARTGARAATNAAAPHAARAGRAMRDAVGEVGIRRAPAPAPRMRGGMAPVDVSEAALSPVPVRPARRIDPVKKMRADAGEPVDAGALFPRAGALSDQAPRPGNASQGAPFNPVGANPGQQGGRANWRMVRLPYDQPPLNVVKNPSEGDLMRLRRESASPSDEFRFVTDEDGNIYVANAMNAEHAWLREGLAEQGIKTSGAGDIRRGDAGWERSTGWNNGEYIPYDPRRRTPISEAERVSARADKILAGAIGADEKAVLSNLRADLRDANASGDSEWAAGLREAIARIERKTPARRGDPDLIAAPGALSDDAARPGNAPDGAPQSGVFAPARPRQGEQSAGIGPETRRTRGARSENTSVLSDYADDMGWAEIAGRAGYASADSAKQNVNVILSRARARIKDGHSVEKVARENGTDAATLQRALSAQRTTPQMAGVDQALDARLRELRRTETVREAARIASEEFGRPVSIGMVQRAEARGRAARPQSMFPLAALGAASAVGGAAGDAEAQYYEYGHPRGRQTPFPAGPGEPASEPRAQEELPRAVRPNEPLSLPALALGALGAVTLRGGARAALSPNVRRAERALAEAPMGRGGRVPITVARRGGNAPQPGPFEFAAQRAAASRNLRDLGGDAAAVSGGGGGAYFGAAMDPNVRNDESRILYALGGASAGGIGSRVANEAGPLLSSLPRRTREEAIVHTPSPMELRRQARTRMLSDSPSTNPRSLRRKDPLIEGEHVRPLDKEGLVRSVENGAVVWRRAAAETPPPRGTPRPVSPQEVNARVRARQSVKAGDDSPFPSMAYAPKGDDGPIPRVQYRYEKYKEPEWWGREPAWRRRIREEGGPSLPAPVPVKPKKPRTGLSPSSLRARVGNAEAVQQVPERAAQAGHSLPKGKSAAETMRNIKTRAQADLGFRAWLNRTFPAIALGLGVSAVGVERSVDENRDAR